MMGNKTIKICTILIITLFILSVKSYGAVAIVKGATTFTNRTISDFFDICREMKNAGQGLEGTNVDVHMATNKEWATVSYFSNSNYGTATQGKNKGISVNIDGRDYLSTNGNATGVMDWGKTATFTSGVISNYSEVDKSSTQYANGKSIMENANNSKLVDLINSISRDSMAANGWYNSWNTIGTDNRYPYSVRSGLFGFIAGNGGGYSAGNFGFASGAANTKATFRPVILN